MFLVSKSDIVCNRTKAVTNFILAISKCPTDFKLPSPVDLLLGRIPSSVFEE